MAYPVLTFATFDELLAFINSKWITNGNYEITGEIGNDVVNGLLTFIRQSPLNWQTAFNISSGADVVITRPVNVFMTNTPTSISWGDNIYNQYIFINTTSNPIPLATGNTYYNLNLLAPQTSIPPFTSVNIFKAANGLWIQGNDGGRGVPFSNPITGIVGGGGTDDPISNTSLYTNPKLKGLAATNNGRIQFQLAETLYSNFGSNSSFVFNNVLGTINISPNIFNAGDSLYINLNQ